MVACFSAPFRPGKHATSARRLIYSLQRNRRGTQIAYLLFALSVLGFVVRVVASAVSWSVLAPFFPSVPLDRWFRCSSSASLRHHQHSWRRRTTWTNQLQIFLSGFLICVHYLRAWPKIPNAGTLSACDLGLLGISPVNFQKCQAKFGEWGRWQRDTRLLPLSAKGTISSVWRCWGQYLL